MSIAVVKMVVYVSFHESEKKKKNPDKIRAEMGKKRRKKEKRKKRERERRLVYKGEDRSGCVVFILVGFSWGFDESNGRRKKVK